MFEESDKNSQSLTSGQNATLSVAVTLPRTDAEEQSVLDAQTPVRVIQFDESLRQAQPASAANESETPFTLLDQSLASSEQTSASATSPTLVSVRTAHGQRLLFNISQSLLTASEGHSGVRKQTPGGSNFGGEYTSPGRSSESW